VIVVDTSALMAIALNEDMAQACEAVLERNRDQTIISAVTLAEALIVAASKNVGDVVRGIIAETDPEIVEVTAAVSAQVAAAYRQWGKGYHHARLNFGDCFAYVLAKQLGCPLLFIGDDFVHTNIASALQ
jgi:ribonuclease VapC